MGHPGVGGGQFAGVGEVIYLGWVTRENESQETVWVPHPPPSPFCIYLFLCQFLQLSSVDSTGMLQGKTN